MREHAPPRARIRFARAAVALAVAIGVIGVIGVMVPTAALAFESVRPEAEPPLGITSLEGLDGVFGATPDGSMLAYAMALDGKVRVWPAAAGLARGEYVWDEVPPARLVDTGDRLPYASGAKPLALYRVGSGPLPPEGEPRPAPGAFAGLSNLVVSGEGERARIDYEIGGGPEGGGVTRSMTVRRGAPEVGPCSDERDYVARTYKFNNWSERRLSSEFTIDERASGDEVGAPSALEVQAAKGNLSFSRLVIAYADGSLDLLLGRFDVPKRRCLRVPVQPVAIDRVDLEGFTVRNRPNRGRAKVWTVP